MVALMTARKLPSEVLPSAKAVLEATIQEGGVAAIGATLSLKRWEEGTWALDPEG